MVALWHGSCPIGWCRRSAPGCTRAVCELYGGSRIHTPEVSMLLIRSRRTLLVVSGGVALLTACGRDERRVDDLLRADLAAAAQAPSMRQQFASPAELGYPQGYAPNGMPQYAYPQQYPQPYGY